MRLDVSSLAEGLEKFSNRGDAALKLLATQGATKMESYAKMNARWTDRSGSARGRLKGSVENLPDGYRIQIAHGVDYGIWLELAHEKQYSILPETIEIVGQQQIIPAFNNLLEKVR